MLFAGIDPFIVIEKKHQLVSSPLFAHLVQFQFITELALKDCWAEGRADREGYTWQSERVLGDVQISLVGAEWDESRALSGSQVRRVAHMGRVLS